MKMSIHIAENHIKLYLGVYLLISLGFSSVVFLKLLFAVNMGSFTIVLYDIYYYVMPSIAILIPLVSLRKPESKKVSRWQSYAIGIIVWVGLGFLYIAYCFNMPLVYVVFPLIPIFLMCLYFKGKMSDGRLLSKKMVAFSLAIIILLPYTVVFLGFNSALSIAGAMHNETERIEFVSDYVRTVTTSFWRLKGFEKQYVILHRASSDFLKFLMVGAGSCGEMAHATKAFFDNLDLESRVVGFPGEDHMFVEVKLNGTWMVVDPGYGFNLVTTEERGSRRLKELGGLSYVVAYTDQGAIDVTDYYVTTDQIMIRVTDSGEPIADAKVILKHTFMGNTISLPEFNSDANGTVKLGLGPVTYNSSRIEPVEPYYWIWVNGRNTKLKASSMGSGNSVLIEIDLAVAFDRQ